jgi:hypothetical protein
VSLETPPNGDPFLSAFASPDVFTLFLPFFARLADLPPHLPELLVSFMSVIVSHSPSLDLPHDIFSIIGSLLISTNPTKLTYSLYLRFSGLLDQCRNETVSKSVLRNLLINFELWIAADASQLIRIVGHWSSSLALAHRLLILQVCTFSQLLAMIRVYFWFRPIETDLIRGTTSDPRPRDPNLDITVCRPHIDRFLIDLMGNPLSETASISLLSHCSSCRDELQVISFLSLVQAIGSRQPSVLRLLCTFCKPSKESICCTALKALYFLAGDSFVNYLEQLLLTFPPCSLSFLDSILELLPDFPLLYPLACFIGLSLDSIEKVGKALRSIKRSYYEAIVKIEFWSLWPAILAANHSHAQIRDIVYFVASVLLSNFTVCDVLDVVVLIDVLSEFQSLSFDVFLSELMVILTDMSLTSSPEPLSCLFEICVKTILLHPFSCVSSPKLVSLYDSSPFLRSIRRANTAVGLNKTGVSDLQIRAAASATFSHSTFSFSSLIAFFKTPPIEMRYAFGIRLPSESATTKSLLGATVALFDFLPGDIPLASIGRYLRKVYTRSKEELPGLEEGLNTFYHVSLEHWTPICDQMKYRCLRHWTQMKENLPFVFPTGSLETEEKNKH